VEAVLEPIRRDPCHVGLTVLVNRKITARSFAGGMAYFDEPDLGDFATLKQLIDRMRAKVSERKLRDQINCFERRFNRCFAGAGRFAMDVGGQLRRLNLRSQPLARHCRPPRWCRCR
jgi:hypothetical protein